MKKVKFLILAFVFALVGAMFVVSDFNNLQSLAEDVQEQVVTISSGKQFYDVMKNPANYSKKIELANDIDLAKDNIDIDFVNDAIFTGSFDGKGHTISNLQIKSNSSYVGLFPRANGATIKNLKIGGDITYKFSTDDPSELYIGVLVGQGNNVTVENCEIGQIRLENGKEQFTKLVLADKARADENISNDIQMRTKFTYGAVAGSLRNASTIKDCVSYLDGSFITTLTASASMKLGGLVGVIENSRLQNLVDFSKIKVLAASENITFFKGGIVGEVQGDKSEIINTLYAGQLTYSADNKGLVKEGAVVGSVFTTCPDSGNISFNYWLDKNLEAFGENANYEILDQNTVTFVDAVTSTFLRNIANWHPRFSSWDLDTTWNYENGKLHLQSFLYFDFSFSSDAFNEGILNEQACLFEGGIANVEKDEVSGEDKIVSYAYKYGDDVKMTIYFKDDFVGYYQLDSIMLAANNIKDKCQINVIDQNGDERVEGYEIIVKSSNMVAGGYSFTFQDIKFECEVVVADCINPENNEIDINGDKENKGGVKYELGLTTTKYLPIQNLSIESAQQAITALPTAGSKWSFVGWDLYSIEVTHSDEGDIYNYKPVQGFEKTSPTIRFKFGEDEFFKGAFRLVANFSDAEAIDVDFTYDKEKIVDIKFNGEVYGNEFPIRVSSSIRVELVITVIDGYEFDTKAFINFMSKRYGGEDTRLLENYTVTPGENDTSIYRFSNINMAAINKGLGSTNNKKIDIQLTTIVKQKESNGNLLWLWIVIAVGGVLAVVGGIVAFIVIRRRNVMRRLGGDVSTGNATKDKIKKTKAKEVDYKDYFN